MRIAFFGAPEFAAEFLKQIAAELEVVVVFTQPDQPAGRTRQPQPTPVKSMSYSISVPSIEETSTEKIIEKLRKYKIDLAILFAYGKLLKPEVLKTPKFGFLNVHPSLLPKYRGVSPMASALINGETETGVSLIQLDDKMDHGPILAQEKIAIDPDDRRPDLERKLSSLASRMTVNLIKNWNQRKSQEQDHTQATFTKFLKREDGFIPLETLKELPQNSRKASEVYNLYRGLYPWPGIWTKVTINDQERRIKLTEVSIKHNHFSILKVQLEGKKEVDFPTFQKAYNAL